MRTTIGSASLTVTVSSPSIAAWMRSAIHSGLLRSTQAASAPGSSTRMHLWLKSRRALEKPHREGVPWR